MANFGSAVVRVSNEAIFLPTVFYTEWWLLYFKYTCKLSSVSYILSDIYIATVGFCLLILLSSETGSSWSNNILAGYFVLSILLCVSQPFNSWFSSTTLSNSRVKFYKFTLLNKKVTPTPDQIAKFTMVTKWEYVLWKLTEGALIYISIIAFTIWGKQRNIFLCQQYYAWSNKLLIRFWTDTRWVTTSTSAVKLFLS